MVALHRVLDSRRHPASAGDLMAELDRSRSTLFRTLGMLRDRLGAPIANAPGRGWFYDRHAGTFELPGLWLRRDELEALLVMDELVSEVLRYGPDVEVVEPPELVAMVRERLERAAGGRTSLRRRRFLTAMFPQPWRRRHLDRRTG